MNRYLISVAALALLAAPAFAQDHDHGGGPGGGGHPGGGAPHAGGPATHGAPGGEPRGGAPAGAARPAAPAAQPGNNGRLDATAVNRALVGDRAPQDNRGPGGNNRPGSDNRGPSGNDRPGSDHRGPGGNDRPGFDNRGPGGNRPGFDNHGPGGNFGPGDRGGMRPGSRPNFSSFRDYHRSFRAPQRFHAPSYRRPSGWYYRRWSFGEILPALFWGQQYWLSDYYSYDLPPPPPGAVWVRYGDDALLIDRYSGEIITVEYGVFY